MTTENQQPRSASSLQEWRTGQISQKSVQNWTHRGNFSGAKISELDSVWLTRRKNIMQKSEKYQADPSLFLLSIGEGITRVNWRKDATVFVQGDRADALFYIQAGTVKITIVSTLGTEVVVATLNAGDFFGVGCMTAQPLYISSATTLAECSIWRLDKAAVVRALETQPAFSEQFMAYLLARNIRTESDLIDHLFDPGEKRLARLLLLLANFGKEGRQLPIIAPISQEILAEMIGATPARVNSVMDRFRRLGFIEYSDRIEVHSSLLSVVLLDESHSGDGGAEKKAKDERSWH